MRTEEGKKRLGMQVSADESGDRSQCWICVWDIMNNLMGPKKKNCE